MASQIYIVCYLIYSKYHCFCNRSKRLKSRKAEAQKQKASENNKIASYEVITKVINQEAIEATKTVVFTMEEANKKRMPTTAAGHGKLGAVAKHRAGGHHLNSQYFTALQKSSASV